MIRNAKPGTIVRIAYGCGPKARVIKKCDLRTGYKPWQSRGVYYEVEILEDFRSWHEGMIVTDRANTMKRV